MEYVVRVGSGWRNDLLMWNCKEVENLSFVDIRVIVHVLGKVKKKLLTRRRKNRSI